MNRETLFLKIVVFLMGIPILGVCLVWLPMFSNFEVWMPKLVYLKYPFLFGMYAASAAFFFALYQTLKLLSLIDHNQAFSELSVRALKYIKYCAVMISILFAASLPLLIMIAQEDDAPGLAALGLVITFGSIVIAVFAAVLQKLLKNAIDIKSENDLTV